MDKSNSTRYRPTNVGVRREEGIKLFQHRLARLYHHFDWPTAVQPSRDMGTIQKNNSQIYPSIGGLDQREPARMHRSIRLLVQRKNVSIVTLSKHHHHVIMMTWWCRDDAMMIMMNIINIMSPWRQYRCHIIIWWWHGDDGEDEDDADDDDDMVMMITWWWCRGDDMMTWWHDDMMPWPRCSPNSNVNRSLIIQGGK